MDTKGIYLLWQAVDRWAKEKPDAEALVFEHTRITWRELKKLVDDTAKAFLELGVERGDRIGFLSMARPEFVISFMAASKVGAIWLGLSPKFTVEELRFIVGHAQPTVLITLSEYKGNNVLDAALSFKEEFHCLETLICIGDDCDGAEAFDAFFLKDRPELDATLEYRVNEVQEQDEALLMYTSGSTGRPKGVLHTHKGIIHNIATEVQYFPFHAKSRALLHFPINHVAADVEIGYGAIYAGSTLVLMDHFDPMTSLEVIEKEKITVVGQVPVMYLMQLQTQKFAELDWSHVEAFIWGGSAAPRLVLGVLAKLASKTGARLITGYGSTELCGFVTYSAENEDLDLLTRAAGRMVPPYEMKIVDAHRDTLPHGDVGEIAVRGPSVMNGYLNSPAQTADVIDDEGWYYTNDLGTMDENGYVYISGRRSEMFKTGGENVFPREIEDVLESHPAVLFSAVVGVPDELYDEVGYAFIMVKPSQTTKGQELREYCKNYLVNFKVPKTFDIRDQLPLLPNGKVNKIALKKELGIE